MVFWFTCASFSSLFLRCKMFPSFFLSRFCTPFLWLSDFSHITLSVFPSQKFVSTLLYKHYFPHKAWTGCEWQPAVSRFICLLSQLSLSQHPNLCPDFPAIIFLSLLVFLFSFSVPSTINLIYCSMRVQKCRLVPSTFSDNVIHFVFIQMLSRLYYQMTTWQSCTLLPGVARTELIASTTFCSPFLSPALKWIKAKCNLPPPTPPFFFLHLYIIIMYHWSSSKFSHPVFVTFFNHMVWGCCWFCCSKNSILLGMPLGSPLPSVETYQPWTIT